MEVEMGLLKYAVLCVRMGRMTPSEAKLFVKGTSRSNPPRQGKRIVWIGSSESEWESIFAEAEKLRDDDKVERPANICSKEVMGRVVLIVVGGILLLVLILTPAAYSFSPFAFGMFGLVFMGFSKDPPPTALEKDFKILEREYGSF